MFKERITVILWATLAMAGITGFAMLMFWILETFHVYEKINYFMLNIPAWVVWTCFALCLLFLLGRFTYWLAIEPYLNYRRTKRETKI